MKKYLKRFFCYLFEIDNEIKKLKELQIELKQSKDRFDEIFGRLEISVDYHEHHEHNNWAVISIAGEGSDFIKFVNLNSKDLMEIKRFMSVFDKSKVDHSPSMTPYFYEFKKPHQKNKRNRF